MFCKRDIVWLKNALLRQLHVRRCTLTNCILVALFFGVASMLFLSYRVNENMETRSHQELVNPPLPSVKCRLNTMATAFQGPNDHTSKASVRTGKRVLIIVETPYSRRGTEVLHILEALRIDYKTELSGKSLPVLTHGEKGKYSLIIFESFHSYINMDNWNRQILDKYCRDYHVGLISFVGTPDESLPKFELILDFPLTVQYNIPLEDYKLNMYSDIWRITRPGEVFGGHLPDDDWTVFHFNHSTYEPLAYSQELKSLDDVFSNVTYSKSILIPSVLDKGLHDGIQRVLFGKGLQFWLHKLMFIDCLSYLSHGKLSISLERFIQIDIDDIFVGQSGTRMKVNDVEALLSAQQRIQKQIDGFHFNLGFSGFYYLHGTDEEDEGDKKLIEYRDKFWWFGHMWRHEQAHKFSKPFIERSMLQNYKFAKKYGIPVNYHYAVAPHHSGVYPVHEPLYDAWKSVWDVRVTSTEEYPRLYPFWRRRGFIHRNIMVLPRQTCGLYTHTIFLKSYPNGREALDESIKGGDIFLTFLYSPATPGSLSAFLKRNQVNIFMTHLANYGNDRLALYTFESAIKFVQCWTNLKLKSVPPYQLAQTYFDMYPEETDPLWQNPCDYKRHISIWSANKTCDKLPKFLVVGPQKTGTTALYTFLAMHPAIISNYNSPETYEEVQFFNSDKYYKGIDWYMEYFPLPRNTSADILFEKSATYFDNELVPMRAFYLLPKAKIICILIDPAKRAYSWYQHMRAHKDPMSMNFTFYDVINADEDSPRRLQNLRSRCLNPGLYAQHLTRWLDYFPSRQIFIIDGEKLKTDPVHVMNNVQRFLHIEPAFDYNKQIRYDPKKGFYCQVVSDDKTKCLGRGKGRKYEPMDAASKEYLRQFYRKHNIALSKLLNKLNQHIPDWLEEELQDIE